ncbi:hypothetical protein HIO71_07640 [Chryseobacterium aquaticum]|uniref:PsbP C-terminal domain-containing protein n=1 Tax=Chryseobacterium aquaticum TaxID=452084 RepID=A0A848N9K9_9FLAO|nr:MULTISPECIES: hypothetical protein [Chryseobacterium]NMR34083.1 hypothetical protein [Chryseobacterium aquaticum]NRQ46158.1 hypothetical protein [Chryseobacterium sp. C-204]
MKKTLFLFAILFSLSLFAQKSDTEVFESENYQITMPNTWKITNDEGIVNIFPSNQIGAITISEYHDLELPKEETKKFILALYNSSDDEKKIKSNSSKRGFTEYFYEYFDEKEKLFWLTKVFQKNKEMYIVSINCQQKYWNGNYMKVFKETFDSFKIKK